MSTDKWWITIWWFDVVNLDDDASRARYIRSYAHDMASGRPGRCRTKTPYESHEAALEALRHDQDTLKLMGRQRYPSTFKVTVTEGERPTGHMALAEVYDVTHADYA